MRAKKENMEQKYYYGNAISGYGMERGYVDYATLAKCFDAVLNNDIMNLTYDIGCWEQVNGTVDNQEEIDELEEKDGMKLIELKSESYKCCFDADNLKKICDILGTTQLSMRLYGEMKVALIIDEKTDNQAVITPIRKYC